jgi:putative peptidoglycan lipid II flippase
VFYAMRDGRTPTLINVFMVVTKVVLVIASTSAFKAPSSIAVALTVATSASYVVGAIVGHVLLVRRLGRLRFGSVVTTVAKVGIASVVAGAVVYAIGRLLGNSIGHGHLGSALTLVAGLLVGLPVLAILLWRMRIAEIRDIAGMVRPR